MTSRTTSPMVESPGGPAMSATRIHAGCLDVAAEPNADLVKTRAWCIDTMLAKPTMAAAPSHAVLRAIGSRHNARAGGPGLASSLSNAAALGYLSLGCTSTC